MSSPNVIICMCDQLRASTTGCYGHETVRTPNIDALAARGTRFELAITSNPVCTPARSSLLSGQYARTSTGMCGNVHQNPPNPHRVRLNQRTVAECFRDAGYRTGLIGKWHVDPAPERVGFDTAIYPNVEHHYYGQTYRDQTGKTFTVAQFGADYEHECLEAFLGAPGEQPFFLFYNISTPHQPIGVGHLPAHYSNRYGRSDVRLRPNVTIDETAEKTRFWYNVYTSADFFWNYHFKRPQNPNDIVSDEFDIVELTRLYYGAVSCTDDQVGKLATALKTNNLLDNTIVVFVSDHGDNLGSHGLFNKNSLIEEAIRIPLVITAPNSPHGQVCSAPASLVDIMPTVLDLGGIDIPPHVQGHSLAAQVRGSEDCGERSECFIETGHMIGIRTPTHLFGMAYNEKSRCVVPGRDWFYDLSQDPYETANLAGTTAQAALQDDLRQRLTRWDADTPWLDAVP